MASTQDQWSDFAWQGLYLSVPSDWNLGRVTGDYKSGYARLDDAEIVRAELEWRDTKENSRRPSPISKIVDRYVEGLEKKARKTGTPLTVQRRAKFLKDKTWLDHNDYEAFTWDADFRAYNLARSCIECGRIVLLRVLCRPDERAEPQVERLFRSLRDHPADEHLYWSVFDFNFHTPRGYDLQKQELKSGHIQFSFQKRKLGCRVQRLSMASMLLKDRSLKDWYPEFFRKDLRDLKIEISETQVKGHPGLHVTGRPRSRWRQLLRPLPFLSPRPRQYMDSRVWICAETNKICIVDHLYRKKGSSGDITEQLVDGYLCHSEESEAEPRSNAELAAGAQ